MKKPYTVEKLNIVSSRDWWTVRGPGDDLFPAMDEGPARTLCARLNVAYSEGLREGAKAIAVESPQAAGRGLGTESAVPVSGHSPSPTLVEQSEDAALPDGRLSDEEIERIAEEAESEAWTAKAKGDGESTVAFAVKHALRYYRDHINKSTI